MSGERKLVPRSGTYLCSMQGSMCRITRLGGRYPPGKKVIKLKGYVKGFDWLDMRQARATWLITLKQGADLKLNKEIKTNEMKLQLDIQGIPYGRWPT